MSAPRGASKSGCTQPLIDLIRFNRVIQPQKPIKLASYLNLSTCTLPPVIKLIAPHYHINLFWSDEDACWIADVPDLKPCSAHGDSTDQALANINDAIEGWLEVAAEKGMPIPEPRYRPAIYGTA